MKIWVKIKNRLRNLKIIMLPIRGIRYLRAFGFSMFIRKCINRIRHKVQYSSLEKMYIEKNFTTKEEFKKERNTVFKNNVKISILVPLYNTPKNFLTEMIESALGQSYENLELCLADGSDDEHSYVGNIAKKYVSKDKRVKYKKLEGNLGISGNTNECIKMATGEYVGLFDHDDLLHESALFEVVKVINEQNADFVYTDEMTFEGTVTNVIVIHFKQDFFPDTLRSYNYICHFSVFSRELLDKAGYFSDEFNGSQDYDIILRLTEKAKKICHIPRVLYYWRSHANSVAQSIAAKPYCLDAARGAIKAHLKRLNLDGDVVNGYTVGSYRVRYKVKGRPLVSILVPNKDNIDELKRCLNSIKEKSTYTNYEIIIVENNSKNKETFEYYKTLKKYDNIKVVYYDGSFNYSLINNFGVKHCSGEYILLLNNDTEVITPNWLEEMLMYAQRKDVGAVGALLLYPNNTVQHAGVIIGLGGAAGHPHVRWRKEHYGYYSRIVITHNLSAVTGACLMVKKSIFEEVGGLDPTFVVTFNDVDFCLKIREKGYLNVYTPFAELYHYESISRGVDNTSKKIERFKKETAIFEEKWEEFMKKGDPCYNKNLTLDREDFSVRIK